jgi:hypothetical protein
MKNIYDFLPATILQLLCGFCYITKIEDVTTCLFQCSLSFFFEESEYSALDEHQMLIQKRILSNAHQFHTIWTKDFKFWWHTFNDFVKKKNYKGQLPSSKQKISTNQADQKKTKVMMVGAPVCLRGSVDFSHRVIWPFRPCVQAQAVYGNITGSILIGGEVQRVQNEAQNFKISDL